MAASISNADTSNWNIPNHEDCTSQPQSQRSSIFPLASFSSLGGGDAPLLANMPRVRSQLFTISTRAVMTSHSQMSVNYTASKAADGGIKQYSSASSSVDSDIEEIARFDVKPLNTEKGFSPNDTTKFMTTYHSQKETPGSCSNSLHMNTLSRSKRCIHGSFEDLLAHNDASDKKEIKGRRKSAPIPSTKGQMIQAANELLVEENKHLVETIQKLKKKVLLAKIATVFTLSAVKRRGKIIKRVEAQKEDKERQCAARLILHSLLLNTWRNTRRELDLRLNDNADLRKSVDNFTLQVQVLRHVQTGERQKAKEKASLIDNLNQELKIVTAENEIMRKEVEKMENELNSLQASTQNLMDENKVLSEEITNMMAKKDQLSQSLDWERLRSEQFLKENCTLKENVKNFDSVLKETTEQKTHWQERARCSESEAWELQLHLESRNNSIKELTASCEVFREEKMKLIDVKSDLKTKLNCSTLALQNVMDKNEELLQTYEKVKAERDITAIQIQELQMHLETTRREFNEIEKELLSYKLKNVRNRRDWGNALYYIVSPMEAVRRRML